MNLEVECPRFGGYPARHRLIPSDHHVEADCGLGFHLLRFESGRLRRLGLAIRQYGVQVERSEDTRAAAYSRVVEDRQQEILDSELPHFDRLGLLCGDPVVFLKDRNLQRRKLLLDVVLNCQQLAETGVDLDLLVVFLDIYNVDCVGCAE